MALLANVNPEELELLLIRKLEDDEDIPENVRQVCEFLCANEVGFVISRNPEARSCREARDKRSRLGHDGIPLFDELKSLVGEIVMADGETQLIALHCRADCEVNNGKLCTAIGQSGVFRLLDSTVLNDRLGLEYGIVNPILIELRSKASGIRQVFDHAVSIPVARIPGTMMTNAGDHTWAIEFDPIKLISALPSATMAEIADPILAERASEKPEMANPRSIGIITGNGPDSGIALWSAINKEIATILGDHFLGDISLPRVTIISVPEMGLSMELKARADVTWQALEGAAEHLCSAGADLIAIACNTTQIFQGQMRRLCSERGATFISMADVVIANLRERNIKNVAIVGIDTVAELGEWSAFSSLSHLDVECLDADTLQKIHDIGYRVKQKGSGSLYPAFQQLVKIFNDRIKAEHIVVALTEISIILAAQSNKTRAQQHKMIVDTLDVYARAIARTCLALQ